jgi:hypothetical protein
MNKIICTSRPAPARTALDGSLALILAPPAFILTSPAPPTLVHAGLAPSGLALAALPPFALVLADVAPLGLAFVGLLWIGCDAIPPLDK